MEILVTTKKDKILEFFLNNPTTEIHLRELSRTLHISFPWTRKLATILTKEGYLTKNRERGFVIVRAARESTLFCGLKRSYNLFSLYKSGLIEKIYEIYKPMAIILFGSFGRGEDIETSDVDIAVITTRKLSGNFEPYEKKIQRRIKLHELSPDKINKDFWNTLANGIVLKGYLELP